MKTDFHVLYERYVAMFEYQKTIKPFTPFMADLTKLWGVDKSTAFRIITNLERLGLVETRGGINNRQYSAKSQTWFTMDEEWFPISKTFDSNDAYLRESNGNLVTVDQLLRRYTYYYMMNATKETPIDIGKAAEMNVEKTEAANIKYGDDSVASLDSIAEEARETRSSGEQASTS